MKEKKARVDDAMHAARAAAEEGIVAGGGIALLRAQQALNDLNDEGDRGQGIAIVKRAMEEPLRQIALNAGWDPSVVTNRVREGKGDFGFNAQAEKFENLTGVGVIDPTKVVRIALQNAASVAGLLITTEAAVATKPEKKKAPAVSPAGGEFDEDY
jgi:chaperonin GroEL